MKHETLKKELKGMLRRGEMEAVVKRLEEGLEEPLFSWQENLVSQAIASYRKLSLDTAAGLLSQEQKILATDKMNDRLFKIIDLLGEPEKMAQPEALADSDSVKKKGNTATLTGNDGILVQGSEHTSISVNKATKSSSMPWILVIAIVVLFVLYLIYIAF
jgi:hypothetical protein